MWKRKIAQSYLCLQVSTGKIRWCYICRCLLNSTISKKNNKKTWGCEAGGSQPDLFCTVGNVCTGYWWRWRMDVLKSNNNRNDFIYIGPLRKVRILAQTLLHSFQSFFFYNLSLFSLVRIQCQVCALLLKFCVWCFKSLLTFSILNHDRFLSLTKTGDILRTRYEITMWKHNGAIKRCCLQWWTYTELFV